MRYNGFRWHILLADKPKEEVMPTTIYFVKDEDGYDVAHPTMAKAKTFKREQGLPSNTSIRAIELKDLPKRELLCALFNKEGYANKTYKV